MKKNLLIITQVVDESDAILGFFTRWIQSFAEHADTVYVIANRVGKYHLPPNVVVKSLGKEAGASSIVRLFRFWKYIIEFLPKSRGLLAHMCPEYVVYGGFVARLMGKKVGLWYLHKSVTWQLRLAEKLVHYIFTAHEKGVQIPTKKLVVTGHGIDLNLFKFTERKSDSRFLRLLTVGRITPSKDLILLLKIVKMLMEKTSASIKCTIIGEPYIHEDARYLEMLQKYIKEHGLEGVVEFIGKVPYQDLPRYYAETDVFMSASRTGGIDKVVLEAALCGVPVVTCSEILREIFPPYALFKAEQPEEGVERVLRAAQFDTKVLAQQLSQLHSLHTTTQKILKFLI